MSLTTQRLASKRGWLREGPIHVGLSTENEASILAWLDKNPNIPASRVVAYDSSTGNPLGHEFILMTREIGECLADVYSSFTSAQTDYVLDLLIDINAELHKHTWSHIGGLFTDNKGNIIPGPVLEETFCFAPDILALWPPGETLESLNISGPYHSYTEYISAHLLKYKHAIEIHPSLEFMRDNLPQLDRFLAVISTEPMQTKLNDVPLRLAHKDLHFANILVDRVTAHATGIVDWEFAGVVPFTRWNPSRAFLWNAQENDTSMAEKTALIDRYEMRARERGLGYLIDDAKFTSKEQENMQTVANFLRAVVEVCPRNQAKTIELDYAVKWSRMKISLQTLTFIRLVLDLLSNALITTSIFIQVPSVVNQSAHSRCFQVA
ncbi:hypothetical protein KCU78_g68, partial [Aureobasidium melanogenum]